MKIKHILTLAVAGILSLSSCDLNEETFTFVSGEDVAAEGGYDKLVASAYQVLGWPFEWGNFHTTANFDCDYQTGPSWAFTGFGTGDFYENGSNNMLYQSFFTAIHRANYHYYLVRQCPNQGSKEVNNALGELRFLKAFCYFTLVQYYGGVPYFETSISEGHQAEQPRASVEEIYGHIIDCLKEAETLMMPRTDSAYKMGHPCRGSAKALLAKVYATIGSASMPAGEKVMVKGGPAFRTNPDGSTTKLLPQEITHEKEQVAGYENFDSKEYYKLARDKALEVINDGEFSLAPNQQTLWSVGYKNGPEFEFCLQTLIGGETIYANYVASDYLGYANPSYNGEHTSGYYGMRDHWFLMFDDWDDERITWGVKHREPYLYSASEDKLYYCYYPERDSVYVSRGENGYDPSDTFQSGYHATARLMKFSAVSEYPLTGERSDWNWPFLRYAETLLLFCEADNEVNGPTSDAISVMDQLNARNNSTLCSERNSKKAFTKESFRSWILEERAKELAEEGHRRTDLIRWGIYLQVMDAIGDYDENSVIKRRERKHLLCPLPADEVNANPYIDRNNPEW